MFSGILAWILLVLAALSAIAAGSIFGLKYTDRPALIFLLLLVVFAVGSVDVYDSHTSLLDSEERIEGEVTATGWTDSCGGNSGCTYYVTLDYTYEYDGEEYTSGNIYAGSGTNRFNSRRVAERWASKYTAGDSISLYISPENPSNSFLEPRGFASAYWWKLPFGTLILFTLGGWILTSVERLSVHVSSFVDRRLGT